MSWLWVEQAEKNYIRAQSINGSHPPAWQGLAEVYQRTDDFEKAIPVLRKLVRNMQVVSSLGIGVELSQSSKPNYWLVNTTWSSGIEHHVEKGDWDGQH